MSAALISLAAELGAPLVVKVLSNKLGDTTGKIAGEVLRVIADSAGVGIEDLDHEAQQHPEVVRAAIMEAEPVVPELIRVYEQEARNQQLLIETEGKDPAWMRAWRPLGMYLIGFLWLWSVVGLHALNAIFKIALPPMDYSVLLQLSGLYMALYMGGHTVKDFATKWAGKGSPG
ncbi:hypothetical protein LA6_003421 [Marinibacterium anthonyi]|nr:hypothetical protein LA6_003421 [Marinibacterium anthonyi]